MLVATSPMRNAFALKHFLNRYLRPRGFFRTELTPEAFILEFHIPYCALREDPNVQDARTLGERPLRASRPLPLGSDDAKEYYHESTNSFMIIGVDEWLWTALCFVEGFYDPKRDVREFFTLARPLDPCIGGLKFMEWPIWNPREYFLTVLTRRLRQAAREWATLIQVFEGRMRDYEEQNIRQVFDISELTHTKQLTPAIAALRRFRDNLATTLSAWDDFERNGMDAFGLQACDGLRPRWDGLTSEIRSHISELRAMHLLLAQRLEFFNSMRDSVGLIDVGNMRKATNKWQIVNASALRESGAATKQGEFVRILTCMTVLFLSPQLTTVRTLSSTASRR